MSIFANVPTAPADPILKLATMFKEDPYPKKVNLGSGNLYPMVGWRKEKIIYHSEETYNTGEGDDDLCVVMKRC